MLSRDVRQTLDHFRRTVDQLFDNFYGSGSRPLPMAVAKMEISTSSRR
jgi:hypothetical protein